MEVKLIERNEIIIGGFSVETTPENNNRDTENLYKDFYNGKLELLNNYSKNTKEYYCVLWYTKLHESFRFLIGQKIVEKTGDFEIKIIPKGLYACSKFPKNYDAVKAWTDFYNDGIPKTGYKPIEKDDIAFEYYPNGLEGEYELWSLVEKN